MCIDTQKYKYCGNAQNSDMKRRRRRRGPQGRIPNPVFIEDSPVATGFIPSPGSTKEPVKLDHAELEVLRLIDLEDLSQEEAGDAMGVSRGTIWRLLQSARRKTTLALVEGRKLEILQSEKAESS
jgi:predicted DNA-binding protein (UPF0251 family)